MRRLLIIFSLTLLTFGLYAQTDHLIITDVSSLTDEQLDTINVKKKLHINDYSMIGVQYGAGLSRVMWNPSQKQDMVFVPVNVGVTYTK